MHHHSDYLYIDRRRISSYFDQLDQQRRSEHPTQCPADLQEAGRSRLTPQASSVYSVDLCRKAAFVLDCLKMDDHVANSFSYGDLRRDFNRNQQGNILSLLDPLNAGRPLPTELPSRDLYYNFPHSRLGLIPFVHAHLQVTQVLFPFTLDLSADNSGIAVWLFWNRGANDGPEDSSNLTNVWILENLFASDVPVRTPMACRYSALAGMIAEHFNEFSKTILNSHQFVCDLENMTFVEFQRSHRETLTKLMYENSVEVAAHLGGMIAVSAREVEVLCRVRDYYSSATEGTHVYAQAVFVRTDQ